MLSLTRFATLKNMGTFRKFNHINGIQSLRRYSQKSINLSEPAVEKYFDYLIMQNEYLLLKDGKSPTEVRRLRKITSLVSVLTQRTCLQKNIEALKISKRCEEDEEVKKMMEEEYETYRNRAKEIENQLQTVLFEPVLSNSGILLELVAAEGDDANLFVQELFNMYTSYGKFKNWRVYVASTEESWRGFKRASVLIEGLGALELMSLEKGVHHRVSDIDQPSRISMVSVSVLPQPDKMEMDVLHTELTVETKKAESDDANSQNSVCVTHTPTGITLTCKSNKSNKLNKYIAIKEMNTLLFNKTVQKVQQSEEKGCTGVIQSSRIIRTYDFIRDRVMEHREEQSQLRLQTFLEGGEDLEHLHDTLLSQQHHQELMNEISKFKEKQHSEDIDEEVYTPGSM